MRGSRIPALLLAAAVAAACGGGTDVKAGAVAFTLNGPLPARAIVFKVVGKQTSVDIPSGQPFRVFPGTAVGDTITVVVVANAGSVLTGEVVSVQVPDLAVKPVITVLQVAGTDYSLKTTSSYALSPVVP
jgi:hypothetical protein